MEIHVSDYFPEFCGKETWVYRSEVSPQGARYRWRVLQYVCKNQLVHSHRKENMGHAMLLDWGGKGRKQTSQCHYCYNLCGKLHSSLERQVLCYLVLCEAGGVSVRMTVWRRSLGDEVDVMESYLRGGCLQPSCSTELWGQIEIHAQLEHLRAVRGISH